MQTYYATPSATTDATGHPVVAAIYRGPQKTSTDVLLARRADPLPALDRLCNLQDCTGWVLNGSQLEPSFSVRKTAKLAQIDADYQAALAAGITVGSITLAAEESDQNIFSRLITMLATAEGLQPDDAFKAAFRASSQTIADHSGVAHLMTVTDLRELIVQYGQAVQAVWMTKATRRAQTAAATTVAALNAI